MKGSPGILAVGTALPGVPLEVDSVAAILAHASGRSRNHTRRLLRQTAIETRHSVLGSDLAHFYEKFPTTEERMQTFRREAPNLAMEAIREMDTEGFSPESITQFIMVSCTGFSAPAIDLELISRCNLAPDVERLHIGFMGCGALFNALRAAHDHCRAGENRRSLIVAVELCSLHLSKGEGLESEMGNLLFGDGAAALLVGNADEGIARLGPSLSLLLAGTHQFLSWQIGNFGFEMHLSRVLPQLIRERVPDLMRGWLHSQNITLSEIDNWVIHPGGKAILDALEESLRLSPSALQCSRDVLRDCGNLSSASLGFLLDQLQPANGSRTLALGFGPGISVEMQLLS